MASKNSTVKVIGIGCGITSLIIILFIVVSFIFIKNKMDDLHEMEQINEQMSAQLNKFSKFPDYNSLIIPKDKLDKFFSIRDSIKSKNKELIVTINEMDSKIQNLNKDSGFWSIAGLVKSGISIIPGMMDFYKFRYEQLSYNQMSLTEYKFIYSTVYFLYSKIPMDSGPGFQISGNNTFEIDSTNTKEYLENTKRKRKGRIEKAVNKIYREYFTEIIKRSSNSKLKAFAANQLKYLKEDVNSLPYRDSLPNELLLDLNTFKNKINSSFSTQLNSIEFNTQ